MPVDRYFVESALKAGERVELDEGEARHLVKVVRGRPGDQVELVNGRGQLAIARVAESRKEQCYLTVVSVEKRADPPPRLVLAIALPRPNRLDTVLEKATELGASDFWLFPGERSEKRDPLSESQLRRLRAVTIAAMKQSGRLSLPGIEQLPALEKWQQLPNLAYFGDVRPTAPPLLTRLPKSAHIQEIALVTGPEGGLTEREIALLEGMGAQGVSLHHNTLRADTAPIVALTLVCGGIATL